MLLAAKAIKIILKNFHQNSKENKTVNRGEHGERQFYCEPVQGSLDQIISDALAKIYKTFNKETINFIEISRFY